MRIIVRISFICVSSDVFEFTIKQNNHKLFCDVFLCSRDILATYTSYRIDIGNQNLINRLNNYEKHLFLAFLSLLQVENYSTGGAQANFKLPLLTDHRGN